jgi:biotin synthase
MQSALAIDFESSLSRLVSDPTDQDLALKVLEQSANPTNALRLFNEASRIRDESIGRDFWWTAGISQVMPCALDPLCTYCQSFYKSKTLLEDIVAAAKTIAGFGFQHMHLSGGANLQGYNAEALEMVQAIRAACDIDIEVNLGPSLDRAGVLALKEAGVTNIASSIEVLNQDLFAKFKPGDSREKRIGLMSICEEEGVWIKGMILVGLGESLKDRLDHLYFLRGYKRMRDVRLSRYFPFPGVTSGGERCSPWETARMVAMARILMPNADIGLANGNGTDDLPLCILAGGGNQVGGAMVSLRGMRDAPPPSAIVVKVNDRVTVVNRIPLISSYLRGMGFDVRFRRYSC